MSPTPLFTHDCNCCRFYGTVQAHGLWGDLYVCERNDSVTERSAVFRTGDDGPDYSSMPVSMVARFPEGHPLRTVVVLAGELAS